MSANFSCYGETAILTPHVDKLAAIGAHHHRSGRGKHTGFNCQRVNHIPELFQDARLPTPVMGVVVSGLDRTTQSANGKKQNGKTDYNFDWAPKMYDSHIGLEEKRGNPSSCKFNCMVANQGSIGSPLHSFRYPSFQIIPKASHPGERQAASLLPRDPVLLRVGPLIWIQFG